MDFVLCLARGLLVLKGKCNHLLNSEDHDRFRRGIITAHLHPPWHQRLKTDFQNTNSAEWSYMQYRFGFKIQTCDGGPGNKLYFANLIEMTYERQ